jgi:hypothetical protein
MAAIPAWILNLVISMVVKFGLPYVLDWLKKRFPWIDLGQVGTVLADHVTELKTVKANKQAIHEKTKQRLRECSGVACPPELKV